MKTKLPYGLGAIMVFSIAVLAVTAVVLSTIGTFLNAYAQNTTTPTQTPAPAPTPQLPTNQTAEPQQIKNYLNQAIKALDNGNNTMALEQVDLAED